MTKNAANGLNTQQRINMMSNNQPHSTVPVCVMVMTGPKPARSFKHFYDAFFSLCVVHKQSACNQACSKTDFHKVHLHAYNYLTLTREETLKPLMAMRFD
jgi:hypothetical protein